MDSVEPLSRTKATSFVSKTRQFTHRGPTAGLSNKSSAGMGIADQN
jgi:hypothetical protein